MARLSLPARPLHADRAGLVPSRHAPEPAPEPVPREEEDRPLVLVVGENKALRAELRARIEWTYRVAEATSGPDGIARALDLVPDLVVSDVTVPDLDGVALLATLREDPRTAHVPVVLLCAGHETGATDALALAAGVARLVSDWEPLLENAPTSDVPTALDPTDTTFLDGVHVVVRERMGSVQFGASALAEAVGLSPRQLRRRLATLTRESPAEYIRRVRIEEAARMLGAGERSVKRVAYETGFASGSGFRAAFQDAHGVSPSAYPRDDLD